MLCITLQAKALVACYAVLSLPFVTLAMDLRGSSYPRGFDAPQSVEDVAVRDMTSTSSTSLDGTRKMVDATSHFRKGVVVNSTTVVRNIPEQLQEVFYFRNHTMVGKKSEGFNLTAFDIATGHPDRSALSPAERLAAGDSFLSKVAGGVLIGAVIGAVCVLAVPGCGAFVGANINQFTAALTGTSAGADAGQAAERIVEAAVGNAPSTLPGAKRDYSLDEGFGCIWEDGFDGTCTNTVVTEPAFTTVTENDGGDNPPIWSCYESTDSSTGEVFGFYSHCFAVNEQCELQCGVGNPEVQEGETQITP